MFSVLGARMFIEEVHAASRWLGSGGSNGGGPSAAAPAASAAAAVAAKKSSADPSGKDVVGMCELLATAGSASEVAEVEAAAAATLAAAGGGSQLRSGAVASAAPGSSLVHLYPPGRILWMLPPPPGSDGAGHDSWQLLQRLVGLCEARRPPPTLVETDQRSLQRFLVTLQTAADHLPDCYIEALASLPPPPRPRPPAAPAATGAAPEPLDGGSS